MVMGVPIPPEAILTMTLLPESATYTSSDDAALEGAAHERDGEGEGDKLASAGEADALALVLREEVQLGEAVPDVEGDPGGGADEAAVSTGEALADTDVVGESEGETDAS